MKWGGFWGATVIVILIFLYEWPSMKSKPKKDKVTFCALLLIGWTLSGFNLLHAPGPTSWIAALFRPYGQFMEN